MSESAAVSVLQCRSPTTWLEAALAQRSILLSDHAACERKAAVTALGLIHRYFDVPELSRTLSRLAREELKHFEQVLDHMKSSAIPYQRVAPGRYAQRLRAFVRADEPGRLTDLLLVAGVIEARSCERFAVVRDADTGELGRFYGRFCAAEARHFGVYFELATRIGREDVDVRLPELLALERVLIESHDSEFRFHSGSPHSGGSRRRRAREATPQSAG